jgi:transposase-like protein
MIRDLTRDDVTEAASLAVADRIRHALKAVLEQILDEEMTEHVGAARRQRSPSRTGERNGSYGRDLITPVGKIEQLRVPRDRDGSFTTKVFEEYHRSTGEVEDAILEMWLQGISQRKIAEVTEKLGAVRIGKDAVSRIAQRLESELASFRSRRLEICFPYLYLDATYLKVHWGSHVGDLAVLVAVGVSQKGFREVLAVETYAGERAEAYRNLLKGLIQRGLCGVWLVVSDDHESIQAAVRTELPGVAWQRCIVHFMRNVLSKVPHNERALVATDLKSIFAVNRVEDARALAVAFCARWGKGFKGAVSTLQAGLEAALCYLDFPSSHHRLIRSTNGLERLFEEVKRRTRVVRIFPNETSACNLSTAVALRACEDWALRRYLDMEPYRAWKQLKEAGKTKPTTSQT